MTHRTLAAASVIAVAVAGTWFWFSRQSNEPTLATVLSQAGVADVSSAPKDAPVASLAEIASTVPTEVATATIQRSIPASAFARRQAIYAAASQANERRVRTLIDEARALPDPIDRIVALEILLLRQLDLDPQAAVASALESELGDTYHLLATLASASPEQVWAAVLNVGDPLARMQYQGAVAGTWGIKDPERAFASIANLPADWTRDQLMRQMAWSITRKDPQLALELVRTRPEHERITLLDAVTDQWSRQDPAAAAQWIEGLGIDMQGRLAHRVAGAFVAQQPEEALAWALRISRSPGKNLWSYMIGEIAATDPHDALRRALAAENPQQRSQALSRALTAIAARDPALAMSYIDKLPAGGVRGQTIAHVAGQIALTRPNTALEWLREIDGPETRMFAASEIVRQLAHSNLESAAQLVDAVPNDVKAIWVQQIAQVYAQSDVQRGIQWIDKHKDDAPMLLEQFVQNVAMYAPDAAFELADRYAGDATRDQLLVGLIGTVANQTPEIAARELTRLSSDNARAQAAGTVASSWAQFDRGAARKWVLSLDSGLVRDTALSQFIPSAGSLDDNLDLVERIQSPQLQMNTVFQTAMRLARTDPEGMHTLLRRHPLDPQRQQQLEQMVKGPMPTSDFVRGWR
jgi:hypothetical protein